ncbi:MAG TPA: flippase [Polyangiales bacterium]
MGAEQKVARSFLTLGAGEAVSRLVAFAATVYLARVLGAAGYGVIAFAAGVNLYLAKLADFGVEAVGTSEVARASEDLPRVVSAVMGARLAFTALLTALCVALALLCLPEPDASVLALYALTLLPIAASTKWLHLGRESAGPIGVTRIVGELLALALVVLLVHRPSQLRVAPLAQLAGDTLVVVALYLVLVRSGLGFRPRWDPSAALPVFRRALPLMTQILLGLFLYNSDLVFLRAMRDSQSVGFYAAAYTLISFLANLGVVYSMSLLPTLTRLQSDPAQELGLYHTALAQTHAVALPITLGGWLVAPAIIETAFGDGYRPAVAVLQMLIWAVPMSAFRNAPWAALVARGQQGLLLRATLYAVGANAALNVVLIHFYGMLGAAVSTVLTESLTGVLMLAYAAREGLSLPSLRRLWRPTLAGCVMALVLAMLGGQPLPTSIASGALAYGLCLVLLGVLKWQPGRLPRFEP